MWFIVISDAQFLLPLLDVPGLGRWVTTRLGYNKSNTTRLPRLNTDASCTRSAAILCLILSIITASNFPTQ